MTTTSAIRPETLSTTRDGRKSMPSLTEKTTAVSEMIAVAGSEMADKELEQKPETDVDSHSAYCDTCYDGAVCLPSATLKLMVSAGSDKPEAKIKHKPETGKLLIDVTKLGNDSAYCDRCYRGVWCVVCPFVTHVHCAKAKTESRENGTETGNRSAAGGHDVTNTGDSWWTAWRSHTV